MGRFQKAIVIGASSGIGEELVRHLAAGGCKVVAVARRKPLLEALAAQFTGSVIPLVHDVRDYGSVPQLFQDATKELGGLDLVIYAAGVMPEVGAEEYNFDKDREMIEVNVLGAMAWLDQAAIRFAGTSSGCIVAIGSVAGDRGRSGQPAYNTSKAALATYMEALRNRLSRKGVTVALVKPGPVDTPMTQHLGLKGAMPAKRAAEIILKKASRTGEHYLSPVHRLAFAIIRNIPSPIFRRMKV